MLSLTGTLVCTTPLYPGLGSRSSSSVRVRFSVVLCFSPPQVQVVFRVSDSMQSHPCNLVLRPRGSMQTFIWVAASLLAYASVRTHVDFIPDPGSGNKCSVVLFFLTQVLVVFRVLLMSIRTVALCVAPGSSRPARRFRARVGYSGMARKLHLRQRWGEGSDREFFLFSASVPSCSSPTSAPLRLRLCVCRAVELLRVQSNR